MKEKFMRGALVSLLTILLVSGVFAPVMGLKTGSDGSGMSMHALPKLQVNESQGKTEINFELSPLNVDNVTKIPSGAIVHHTNEGLTRIFNPEGKQIVSARDSDAKKIVTPGGTLPATHVYQVPSESHIEKFGNILEITKDGNLLLTIINDGNTDFLPDVSGWIEDAEDTYVSQLRQFDAYWRVPSNPPSSEYAEPIFLFNAITPSTGGGIIQPVLEWNQPETGLRWTGAAWAVINGVGVHSNRINANRGDVIKGRLYWSTTYNQWYIQIYDVTTGQYQSLYSSGISDTNLAVYAALEGYQIDDNSDVPGDTTFYDMVYKYNGIPVSVYLVPWINSHARTHLSELDVGIISNPSSVKLYTAN